MSGNLKYFGTRNNEDFFRKLGIESPGLVSASLGLESWITNVEGNSDYQGKDSFDYEAEIGELAARKVLNDYHLDGFIARTLERGSYSRSQDDLEWRDGLVHIEPGSAQDYFSVTSGDLPWDTVEFLALPYDVRHGEDTGFSPDDWQVT